ncbi:hypothetical protein DIPPA_65618, partial [Diplonema papillatum]
MFSTPPAPSRHLRVLVALLLLAPLRAVQFATNCDTILLGDPASTNYLHRAGCVPPAVLQKIRFSQEGCTGKDARLIYECYTPPIIAPGYDTSWATEEGRIFENVIGFGADISMGPSGCGANRALHSWWLGKDSAESRVEIGWADCIVVSPVFAFSVTESTPCVAGNKGASMAPFLHFDVQCGSTGILQGLGLLTDRCSPGDIRIGYTCRYTSDTPASLPAPPPTPTTAPPPPGAYSTRTDCTELTAQNTQEASCGKGVLQGFALDMTDCPAGHGRMLYDCYAPPGGLGLHWIAPPGAPGVFKAVFEGLKVERRYKGTDCGPDRALYMYGFRVDADSLVLAQTAGCVDVSSAFDLSATSTTACTVASVDYRVLTTSFRMHCGSAGVLQRVQMVVDSCPVGEIRMEYTCRYMSGALTEAPPTASPPPPPGPLPPAPLAGAQASRNQGCRGVTAPGGRQTNCRGGVFQGIRLLSDGCPAG